MPSPDALSFMHAAADHMCGRNFWFSKPVLFNVESACPVQTARWDFWTHGCSVIAQTGSEAVSHVAKTLLVVKEKPVHAHRGPAEVCLFPIIFPSPWETFTSREEFTLTLF